MNQSPPRKLPYAAVVPVFNPEPGLVPFCRRVAERFAAVVVVDDGSVEGVDAFSTLPDAVTILRHSANAGKGRAMKTALAWLRANRPDLAGVVFADGDGQHRLEDAVAVAERSLATDRVVFGVRDFSAKGVPFRSWWGNRWAAAEVWLLFGFRLADTQTGLRAVPRRLFDGLLTLRGERFEYEAGWFGRLKRLGEPILQVPVRTIYRAENRASHFHPLKDTLLTQRALFSRDDAEG